MPVVEDELLQELTDFQEKPLEWVWDGLIPSGTVTLLTGNSGMGKSLVALNVAAMVTRGIRTPPIIPPATDAPVPPLVAVTEPRAVILFSAEEAIEQTIVPRLKRAQAEISRILVHRVRVPEKETSLTGGTAAQGGGVDSTEPENDRDQPSFRLTRELARLEASLQRLKEAGRDVGLIVIDPIEKYLGPSDKGRERIGVVTRLAELASKWDLGILVITNSTPKSGTRSQAAFHQELAQTARSVLTILPNHEDSGQRLVLPVKLNVAEMPPAVPFSVLNGVIRWDEDRIFLSVEDHAIQGKIKLKNPLFEEEFARAPELRRVILWLREQLLPGRASSNWIRALSGCQKVAYSTLRRAFKALGCRAKKEENGQWFWYLPGHATPACEDVIAFPLMSPESISGISREFTPDNFTCWSKGRNPDDAIFAGANNPADEPPLMSTVPGELWQTRLMPTV